MDLVSTINPPRIVYLAGQVYWVRAISIEGMAILLAWLDDVIPGRAERKMPPEFSSEEARRAIDSPVGRAMLTWIALREQGIDFSTAGHMSDELTDEEQLRLFDVLFCKRRTAEAKPGGEDISKTWCAKGMANFAGQIGLKELASYSTDQIEWLMSEGELDANPQFDQENLTKRQDDWSANELPQILMMIAEQKVEAI